MDQLHLKVSLYVNFEWHKPEFSTCINLLELSSKFFFFSLSTIRGASPIRVELLDDGGPSSATSLAPAADRMECWVSPIAAH